MKLAMPVKTVTLDFTGDGYPGFECETWVNPPIREAQRYYGMADAEQDEAREILLAFFPSWNFVGIDGVPIPHTPEGFDLMPQELLIAMGKRRNDAVRERAMPGPLENTSSRSSRNGTTDTQMNPIQEPITADGR